MTAEEWRPIPGFPEYEVSSHGRVLSRKRYAEGRILNPRPLKAGHLQIKLSGPNGLRWTLVHRLVLEVFVGPCPEGLEGCHNNGDPADNRVSNLRWDTRQQNMQDSILHGTNAMKRKTHCPRGHAYTEANTRIERGPRRSCRTCNRARSAAYNGRRPERAAAQARRSAA